MWWVEIHILDRPNNYFVPSLSFSNNQLVYLSKYTKLSNQYKNEFHNTKLYVAQYNKSKRIGSLVSKSLANHFPMILPRRYLDISWTICELNTERCL